MSAGARKERRRGPVHPGAVTILGLSLTAGVVLLQFLGAFELIERKSIDLRYAVSAAGLPGLPASRRVAPLSDEIRLVVIDDGALHASVGRWPWPRSKLADGLKEIVRLGARTVALDVLFPEAQDAEQDALLAEALSGAACVLSVGLEPAPAIGPLWSDERGRTELASLRRALIDSDFRRANDPIAGLSGPRLVEFLDRPYSLADAILRQELLDLTREGGGDLAVEEFLEGVAPGVKQLDDAPRLVRRLWSEHLAWRALADHLLPAEELVPPRPGVPQLVLARAAAAVGFVHFEPEADGAVRDLGLLETVPGGHVMQLGLAAAARHLEIPRSEIVVTADELAIRGVHLQLHGGRLYLAWPTASGSGWESLHQGDAQTPSRLQHASLGWFVELAERRRRTEDRRGKLTLVNQDIFKLAGLRDSKDATVEEHIDWDWPELEEVPESDRDPDDLARLALYEMRASLKQAIENGTARIARDERRHRTFLQERLVFVGFTATGLLDAVPTPLDPQTPGVLASAVLADMVLGGRRLHFAPPALALLATVLLGLLLTLAAAALRLPYSILVLVAAFLGYGAVGWTTFAAAGWVLPVVPPATSGLLAWVGCTALVAALAQRDRSRITRQFKSRTSPQLVELLLRDPDSLHLEGEKRVATTLFADLAGFTRISESLGGPRTVAVLNRCMGEMARVLVDHGAYVNKFLGDGVMAFWSAFVPDPEQGRKASLAALECLHVSERLRQMPQLRDLPPVNVRVGVATGPVIVGDCGAPPDLRDFTAIGNSVNLAARLESANKQFGTRVLVDGPTRLGLTGTDPVRVRPIGRVVVVGQSQAVDVFEVLSPGTLDEMLLVTGRAVRAFQEGDFETSRAAWAELEAQCGPSLLAERYRVAMEEQEPGAVVAGGGVLVLTEK